MHRLIAFGVVFVLVCGGLGLGTAAHAQGLVWSLPPDGSWVRYEGEYVQKNERPDEVAGAESITWRRRLEIKSVGQEMVEHRGETVPGRWLEFHVVTGNVKNGMIVPGPGGERIYKVLVPEPAVTGQLADRDGIPVAYLPIAKGWQKVGDGEPTAIESGVLQVYPVLTLIGPYRNLEAASEQAEDPMVTLQQPVTAVKHQGELVTENHTTRTTNRGELWRSDEVPFGLARWRVELLREEKKSNEPRSEFKKKSTITVDMKALAMGADAQSALVVP